MGYLGDKLSGEYDTEETRLPGCSRCGKSVDPRFGGSFTDGLCHQCLGYDEEQAVRRAAEARRCPRCDWRDFKETLIGGVWPAGQNPNRFTCCRCGWTGRESEMCETKEKACPSKP